MNTNSASLFTFIRDKFLTACFKIGIHWSDFHATERNKNEFKPVNKLTKDGWVRNYKQVISQQFGTQLSAGKAHYMGAKIIRKNFKVNEINNFYAKRRKAKWRT